MLMMTAAVISLVSCASKASLRIVNFNSTARMAASCGSGDARAVRNTDGSILYHVGAAENITARKTAEEQVELLAYYDALTGLPNRTLFRDRLGKALASARRRERKSRLVVP